MPFVAGDPMRLAAVLARKNCITKDDDPEQVAHVVPQAAASLASTEIAAALRIPCRTASLRVEEADTMTTVLAPTLDALERGVSDRVKARVIADTARRSTRTNPGPGGPGAPGVDEPTTSELRDVAGQAVIIVDPDGAENPHQEAAARRELRTQPLPRHGLPEGEPPRRRCGEDLPGQRPAGHRHRRHPRRQQRHRRPPGPRPRRHRRPPPHPRVRRSHRLPRRGTPRPRHPHPPNPADEHRHHQRRHDHH